MNTMKLTSRASLFSLSLLAVAALSGCTEQLPPPSAPAREVPKDVELPTAPPPAGSGRVLIDANGDRAKVVEITGSATAVSGGYHATVIGLRPLCTTPCVVDLRYGSHPLVLRSTTDKARVTETELEVGPSPKVARYALGEKRDGGAARTIGMSAVVLGAITALTGALLLGVGELARKEGQENPLGGSGRVVTGIGAAGVIVSLPLLFLGRPSERPGASTEWTLRGTEPGGRQDLTPLLQGAPSQSL